MRRAVAPALLALALALTGACEDEALTEIVLVVDSDIVGLASVTIEVEGFTEPLDVEVDLEQALPRRLSLVHEGGPLGPISITVSGYLSGETEALIVERRSDIRFERDRTRMLRINLLTECIGFCADGLACVAGPRCVAREDAWELEPWTGDVEALGTVDSGAIPGTGADAGRDAAVDGATPSDDDASVPEVDAGPPPAATGSFQFVPSNFDPEEPSIVAVDRRDVVLDCGRESVFDSASLTFTDWCGDEPPTPVELMQGAGLPLVALVMDSLDVATGDTLRLIGDRPVALVVFGDVRVRGLVDASAAGSTPGPGADLACNPAASGLAGPNGNGGSTGAGGGGGGGFGGTGGGGGFGGQGTLSVPGGMEVGNRSLSPLRGGCSGGSGGSHDGSSELGAGGGGGGAIQLSAAGRLDMDGVIAAAGGGGGVGAGASDGGGGGGSGGAILLEAAVVDFDSAARLLTNGGGGGAGQPSSGADSSPGEDGSVAAASAAPGGAGAGSSSGSGGPGGSVGSAAAAGESGSLVFSVVGGGGGGGGSVGRVRVNRVDSCVPLGVFSPSPSLDCPDCANPCVDPPGPDCTLTVWRGRSFYACTMPRTWSDALAVCQAAGVELPAPANAEENDFLSGLLANPAWLGGTDQALEGSWVWSDGTAFWTGVDDGAPEGGAYANWTPGQPGGSPVEADCVELESDGTWDDITCDATRPYVCAQ